MSRPRYYWYSIVKKMIYRYPKHYGDSEQEKKFKAAIEQALEKTKNEIDGEEKIKAINIVCFEKKYTLDGAAKLMNYSRKTIQRWIIKFTKDVGKNAGF